MNCQDVSRLIDCGDFGALAVEERRAAETHAMSCRHCAPLWLVHAHLSAAAIPSMPVELLGRCRMGIASRSIASASRHKSRRVMLLVGGLVALTAAASILLVNHLSEPAAASARETFTLATEPALSSAPPAIETPAPEPAVVEIVAPPASRLPLLPAPLSEDEYKRREMAQALQKAVECWPELIQGPEKAEFYAANLMLPEEGAVLCKELKVGKKENVNEFLREFATSMMAFGVGGTVFMADKGTRIADGSVLMATLTLQYSMLPRSFDESRTSTRVQQLLQASHSHLLLPVNGPGINYLTVLLAEDGTILNEATEFHVWEGKVTVITNRPDEVAKSAQEMARKLGISVDKIGQMGMAALGDAAGPDGARRSLRIEYAWQRRLGESGPTRGWGGSSTKQSSLNTADVLAVVERVMPEAFLKPNQPNVKPSVILTEGGEVIRTGYLTVGGDLVSQLQSLAPGMDFGSSRTMTVTNAAGEKADVMLVWQVSAATKSIMEKNAQKQVSDSQGLR